MDEKKDQIKNWKKNPDETKWNIERADVEKKNPPKMNSQSRSEEKEFGEKKNPKQSEE